jgi:trehalose-6-phosphate synthase
MASALKQALTMTAQEREARMGALRTRVHGNNLDHWSHNFLSALEQQHALVRYATRIHD